MSWLVMLQVVLGSGAVVGLFKTLEVLAGKWRPRTAIEDDRSTKAFNEMRQVAEAYKEVVEIHKRAAEEATNMLHEVTHELEGAKREVTALKVEVKQLETALTDAHGMIQRLMSLVSAG